MNNLGMTKTPSIQCIDIYCQMNATTDHTKVWDYITRGSEDRSIVVRLRVAMAPVYCFLIWNGFRVWRPFPFEFTHIQASNKRQRMCSAGTLNPARQTTPSTLTSHSNSQLAARRFPFSVINAGKQKRIYVRRGREKKLSRLFYSVSPDPREAFN